MRKPHLNIQLHDNAARCNLACPTEAILFLIVPQLEEVEEELRENQT
jgi:hypothetical protein